jgi:hypothetical protein
MDLDEALGYPGTSGTVNRLDVERASFIQL